MRLETSILHSLSPDELTGAISTPIYQTSTYVQEAPGVNKGYDYARSNNPTRKVVENLIAKLEFAEAGFAFASGLAAIDAVIKLLSTGDEIVAVDDIYGGTFRIFTHIYQKFGINIKYIDTTESQNVADAVSEKTKLVWLESPTNPTLKISDIKTICDIAHSVGVLVVVDNTFASPILQNPILLGADIIIHSATKYLGGHSDLIAGLVAVNTKELAEKIKFIQNSSGGILGPFDSWLLIRGIETLKLRVEQHSINAFELAKSLVNNPFIDEVFYPGLQTHKNHKIAATQQSAFGGMISFTLKNDDYDITQKIVSSTKYFKLAESLGGVKSLICHPAAMTHKSIPREVRIKSGVKDSLIRLSVGLEHFEDLIEDINEAINKYGKE
jgi:cystathionine beta-lyase